MDKQDVVYPHNGVLFNRMKDADTGCNINLGNTIQSERSQTQKATYCMIPFL